MGLPFSVYVGTNGDETDTPAFGGRPGNINRVIPASTTSLSFYMPMLDPGIYSVYFKRDDAGEEGLLTDGLIVFPAQLYRTVYNVRRTLPPVLFVGPRSVGQEDVPLVGFDPAPTTPVITGSYAANDISIAGTAGNDLGSVEVFIDSESQGTALVLDGAWSLAVRPLVSAESLTATVTTLGGTSAASTPVVVA